MSQDEVRVAANGRRACIFYKLMVDSLILEKQLAIPKTFARKYGGELSDVVRLVASDTSIWLVKLMKHKRSLWFHDGWQRFLEHYSIHSGQFLIFKYEGDSTFHVYIYDLSASSENNSHNPLGSKEFISRNQFPMHMKENQDPYDVVEIKDLCGACPICSCFKDKCIHECQGWQKTNRIHDPVNIIKANPINDREVFYQDKEVQVDGAEIQSTFDGIMIDWLSQRNRYLKRRKQINESNESGSSVMRKNGGELPPVEATYVKSSREWNAKIIEARGMAICASHRYMPNNPFFRVIMRPSYVRERFLLNLPASFVGMHLKGATRDITLQISDGKKWCVRCILFGGKGKISRGWREFVVDNKLEIGDVCIFELVRREDIVLNVTIFQVPVEATYVKSSRKWNAKIIEGRGMAIRASHRYMPNNPFFRVIMRPSYVREKFVLNLPASLVGMHLKGATRDITLQISDGKKWCVRCILFGGKGKISRGWREFVVDNKLEIGDVCIFELVRREDIVLTVTIFQESAECLYPSKTLP